MSNEVINHHTYFKQWFSRHLLYTSHSSNNMLTSLLNVSICKVKISSLKFSEVMWWLFCYECTQMKPRILFGLVLMSTKAFHNNQWNFFLCASWCAGTNESSKPQYYSSYLRQKKSLLNYNFRISIIWIVIKKQ